MTSTMAASKPFDVAMKHLLEMDPHSWARFLGAEHHCDVEVIDSDLATVSASADKILKFMDPM